MALPRAKNQLSAIPLACRAVDAILFFFPHILVQYAPETNHPSELVLGRQKLPLISAETNGGIEKNLLAPPAGCHYSCKIKVIGILKVFGKEKSALRSSIAKPMITCGDSNRLVLLPRLANNEIINVMSASECERHYCIILTVCRAQNNS